MQTQAPPRQTWPEAQAGEPPHRQAPFTQELEMAGLQTTQAAPEAPHAAVLVPGWHALPWQQPPGHDVASHTHVPLAQRCPAAQGAPAPHLQLPLMHESAPMPQARQTPAAVPQAAGSPTWQAEP